MARKPEGQGGNSARRVTIVRLKFGVGCNAVREARQPLTAVRQASEPRAAAIAACSIGQRRQSRAWPPVVGHSHRGWSTCGMQVSLSGPASGDVSVVYADQSDFFVATFRFGGTAPSGKSKTMTSASRPWRRTKSPGCVILTPSPALRRVSFTAMEPRTT
jgi:hypothetical protein